MTAWQRQVGWRRFDERGEDRAMFVCGEDACLLQGVAAIAINGSGLLVEYRVETDADWQVRRALSAAQLGGERFTVTVERVSEGSWNVDGVRAAALDGCTDVDLAFSAATNTLVIRRLGLRVGETGFSRAVYLEEPTLTVTVLDQAYERISETEYRYRAGDFSCTIRADSDGIVEDYPGRFKELDEDSDG